MSLYNMLNGVNMSAFIILPILGKHPEDYPRFRDVFFKDEEHPEYDNKIQVYTRVGGGNRESYSKKIKDLTNMEGYITNFDDNFDSTYATFVFELPKKWKKDIDLLLEGKVKEVSKEYVECIVNFWKKNSKTSDFYKKIEKIFAD